MDYLRTILGQFCTILNFLSIMNHAVHWCKKFNFHFSWCKHALTTSDLQKVLLDLAHSQSHDDFLFRTMLLTGFFALMRLGELSFPNDISLRNWKKVTKWSTVTVSPDQYAFHLPFHKADPFFEGNHVIIKSLQYCDINPLSAFNTYLESRDQKFPLLSPLWLTSKGAVPTRQFFITRLRCYFDKDVAGQSMRAGGATSLAENGVPPSLIQFIGHWTSDAFFIYTSLRRMPPLYKATSILKTYYVLRAFSVCHIGILDT